MGSYRRRRVLRYVGICLVAQRTGRRLAFVVAFLGAFGATALFFGKFSDMSQMWMSGLMGFFQLALFAGFAIYLPSCSRHACEVPVQASATTWTLHRRHGPLYSGHVAKSAKRCSYGQHSRGDKVARTLAKLESLS